mgnify:CR=1 FL=1
MRYCGAECQRADWAPRHKAECKAWRAEADAAVVAAGGCPLGDVKAQEAAIGKWAAPERTLAAMRAAAEGGDIAAQYALGNFFCYGKKGAPQDRAQAVVWLRRSAAGNVARAQDSLGFMQQRGEGGLAVDLAEGARLLALATAQGLASAQYNLGCCYNEGEGMPRDFAEAARLFRLGAEQGDARAQANLSTCYINGEGVAVDYAEAMRWARLSADKGNAVGEFNVGALYANGWGVSRDLRAATMWFSRAATRGNEQAKEVLLKFAADGVPVVAFNSASVKFALPIFTLAMPSVAVTVIALVCELMLERYLASKMFFTLSWK